MIVFGDGWYIEWFKMDTSWSGSFSRDVAADYTLIWLEVEDKPSYLLCLGLLLLPKWIIPDFLSIEIEKNVFIINLVFLSYNFKFLKYLCIKDNNSTLLPIALYKVLRSEKNILMV